MTDGHVFNNILLGGRGGTSPGQLRVHSGGLTWRKQGSSKSIDVRKDQIANLTWMKIPRTHQLGVRSKDGVFLKFMGFRELDVSSLNSFFQKSMGIVPEEKQLSVCGHNWGEVDINGNMLTFLVGSNQAFEVSLADVAQMQLQGKTDVMLEFHVDDTAGATEKDYLTDLSFHVPNSNTQFVGDENHPPAQVMLDKIMPMADVGSSEEAVVSFEGVAILTPRGRYSVDLHLSFLRLQGLANANDFKIQYSSVVRLFVLPKSNQPHTFVVVTLDPPIRKGQTLYPHIVLQFETELVVSKRLSMKEDLLASKYKDKLEGSYKGLVHEVFTIILRGLSASKVTRTGKFRSFQDGYAVKSSLKAEDGLLYPLEKGFFFLPKPPTLVSHDEIEYVEFQGHGAGGSSVSSHYFDVVMKLKNDQEHLFRNIQKSEYHNLYSFISDKHLKIMNGDTHVNNGVSAASDDEVPVDPHIVRIRNEAGGEESDEEDEDFVAEKDDSGSPTDDSGEEDSDASKGSADVKEKPPKKDSRKETSGPKAKSAKRSKDDGDEDGPKKRRQKKKKDPNAPKRSMSAFLFFSNAERSKIVESNPGISVGDVARALGEKWKKLSAGEKEPYESMARADTKRYKEAMASYKNDAGKGEAGSGSESA